MTEQPRYEVPWAEWHMPDAYSDEEQATIFVPIRSARSEEEAFEHVLTDLTDWSWREKQRAEIRADYLYDGIHETQLCEHDFGDPHHRSGKHRCPKKLQAHRFTSEGGP